MTDDELKSVGRVIGAFSSGSYAQGFEAGYRAGLEKTRNTFVDIQRKKMAVDACELFGQWLDAKLGEQP